MTKIGVRHRFSRSEDTFRLLVDYHMHLRCSDDGPGRYSADRAEEYVEQARRAGVDEIGFTDMLRGSGHGGGGASRVTWIEVYGNAVPRAPQSSSAK